MVQEADRNDEGFAVCVVGTLNAMCERLEGAAVAVLAGAVQQGIQTLTSAQGYRLQMAALTMLEMIARNSYSGCRAMRDVIETTLTLSDKSFHVTKSQVHLNSVLMMMIAFITIKSSLVPLIEGLCAQIYSRFEISVVCSHLLLFFFVKEKTC